MDNYTNNMLQTIDAIVTQKLNTVAFDKTEICEIISRDSEDKQKYLVSNGAIKFEAYAMDNSKRYSKKSQVYVLIPKGDYGGTKIIIGGQGQENSEKEMQENQYDSPLNNMIIANEIGLISIEENNKLTINKEATNDYVETIININDLECETGFGKYDYVGIDFSLNSNIVDNNSDYGLKLDFLDEANNSIITTDQNYLVLHSEQIYGNPNALNESFSFQHLFYFPKLRLNYNFINKIKVTLMVSEDFTTNDNNFVELTKLKMYFGYFLSNEKLLHNQAIMSISFPKDSKEDIQKSYISPLSPDAPENLKNKYEDISESYKTKQLRLDWFKNNQILHGNMNNEEGLSQLDKYDIYWCQYLSKTPYTKLLDNDIDAIKRCYYKEANGVQWIDNNLAITDRSFEVLYFKVSKQDNNSDSYTTIFQSLDNFIGPENNINEVKALYYLKTENISEAPSSPEGEITNTSDKKNQWTIKCPINQEAQGVFYTCIQKKNTNGELSWTQPICYENTTTIKQLIISFTTSSDSFVPNVVQDYYNNLMSYPTLKDKFINNNALLNEYKNIYNENKATFEKNLLDKFKDIIESGTYWQTLQKINASDIEAYFYNVYLPISGSEREQNEEQVKAIIKNRETNETIEVNGFTFQNVKTIENLIIDEELDQIDNNIVTEIAIETGRSNSHVKEPSSWEIEDDSEKNPFLWTRQKMVTKNDKTIYGPSMCITNETINNLTYLYYLQLDGTTAPEKIPEGATPSDTWTTLSPTYKPKGQFWTCLSYEDNNNKIVYTTPIQAIAMNPPKKNDTEFIGTANNQKPIWNDVNWNTIYNKSDNDKYVWHRTKTTYTNNIVQYGDSIYIDGAEGKNGKAPVTIIDLYYLATEKKEENWLLEQLSKYKLNEEMSDESVWTKLQPTVPPSNSGIYYTALYYIYDDDSTGYGIPVIDEQLTATAAAVNNITAATNVFFTRTDSKTPDKINDGSKEETENNIIIIKSGDWIWYNDVKDIPKIWIELNDEGKWEKVTKPTDENAKAKEIWPPYLWQCTQTKTKAGDTYYTAPTLLKTQQSIDNIELYYLSSIDKQPEPPIVSGDIKTPGATWLLNQWYTAMPPWENKDYKNTPICYYTCVQTIYDNGDVAFTTPTKSQGIVINIDIEFAAGNNLENHPDSDSGWTTNSGEVKVSEDKPFKWSRQVTTYNDGTISYSGYNCINLRDVKSVVELYCLAAEKPLPPSKAPDGTWSSTLPDYKNKNEGEVYYTCVKTTYLDTTASYSEITEAVDKTAQAEATLKTEQVINNAKDKADKAETAASNAINAADKAEAAAQNTIVNVESYFTTTNKNNEPPQIPSSSTNTEEKTPPSTIKTNNGTIWYKEYSEVTNPNAYLWQIYRKITVDKQVTYTSPFLIPSPIVYYSLNTTANAIKKDINGSYTPETITFNCLKHMDNAGEGNPHECYWEISINSTSDYITSKDPTATYELNLSEKQPDFISVKIYSTADINVLLDELFIPVIKDGEQGPQGDSGAQGNSGTSGQDTEYIYYLSNSLITNWNGKFSFDSKDWNLANGWSEKASDVSEEDPYLYISTRRRNANGVANGWGDFSASDSETGEEDQIEKFSIPTLWGKYGHSAINIQDINTIHYLQTNSTEVTLPNPSVNISNQNKPNVWTTIKPTFRNNGAYWTCLQYIYDDGTKLYTSLQLINPSINIVDSKIQDLYSLLNTELIDELEIIVEGENSGVYNYYEQNYKLETSKQNAIYNIVANFPDNKENGPANNKKYEIFWEMPKSATMLKAISNENNGLDWWQQNNGIDDGDDYYEYSGELKYDQNGKKWEYKTFSYSLEQIYAYNKVNNTIWCKIVEYDVSNQIDRKTSPITKVYVGKLKQELKFGLKGTSGTEWRLNITADKTALCENDTMVLTAVLQDGAGNQITGNWVENLSWEWYQRSDTYFTLLTPKEDATISQNQSKIQRETNEDPYAIVKATVSNLALSDTYNVDLIAYFPIASITGINSGEGKQYYLNGPTVIVYNREGVLQDQSSNYPYELFYKGELKSETTFSLLEDGKAINETTGGLFKLVGNVLRPCACLPSQSPKISVKAFIGANYYYYPVLIVRDIYYYKRELINQWDGALKVDSENNAILAASFIAGRKGADNTFSGVLLGEIGKDINNSTSGIYGLSEGKCIYKITEDEFKLTSDNMSISSTDQTVDITQDQTLRIRLGKITSEIYGLDIYDGAIRIYGKTADSEPAIKFDSKGNMTMNGIFSRSVETGEEFNYPYEGNIITTAFTNKVKTVLGEQAINIDLDYNSVIRENWFSGITLESKYQNAQQIGSGLENSFTTQTLIGMVGGKTYAYYTNTAMPPPSLMLTTGTKNVRQIIATTSNDTTQSYNATILASSTTTALHVTDWGKPTNDTQTAALVVSSWTNKPDDKDASRLDLLSVRVYGTFYTNDTTSDARLKHDIEVFDDRYEVFFDNLLPKRYKYNNGTSNRYHTGFIAQEVITALESASITTQEFAGVMLKPGVMGEEDCYHLRRDEFVSLNTWQIQKLKTRVTELEQEIKEIKQKYEI